MSALKNKDGYKPRKYDDEKATGENETFNFSKNSLDYLSIFGALVFWVEILNWRETIQLLGVFQEVE